MIKKVAIDIGHLNNTYDKLGSKGIKINRTNIEEFNLNVLIAESLKSILESQGISVKMIFSNYKTKGEPDNLSLRCDFINAFNPDISISIHHDYSSNSSSRGFTIYTWKGNVSTTKIKKQITNHMKKTSKECALNYNGYSICYPKHQNFALVRQPKCNAMLIECGFFSNWDDIQLTMKYHWSIAYRIACGLLNKTIEFESTTYDKVVSGINIVYDRGWITDKIYWNKKSKKDEDIKQMFINASEKN